MKRMVLKTRKLKPQTKPNNKRAAIVNAQLLARLQRTLTGPVHVKMDTAKVEQTVNVNQKAVIVYDDPNSLVFPFPPENT